MFLLDTVVISETRRPSRHRGVMAWIEATPKEAQFVPAVAFWEIQRGIDKTRLQDPAKADEIEAWMDGLLATAQVVPMTGPMFKQLQVLLRRRSNQHIEDLMIAATASIARMIVATRNVRHFEGLGVSVYDPWTYSK